ncbi:type III-B CRISPR module RAMP protein Cmr6 [Candidatus Methylacidiphilum fumarolicum]|uniref:CRISPR type III-associated protein domain-containing protein n=2 Tax=Candidatus Methylacidiphilum fumarolicum TaxID=591154 RepID=I0JZ00_METFB|nr:type III-B CRISPR module RAMP protein Cmr6 [Candidatus Methylacidiphilum fumarolicum]MBW6414638.1 type III-B CRISPR module RAMP protein Cmr6 [Candidatus Methylacidiphilum fumarolicum]TFE65658.1 type III-B CRISPR module RAMP protein Cmr6 [Candidatus Methylacidiphilum fumarolicum]TFE75871.1 type III-B CRISPR module RAMP protein Cmr6 [Candidatus Methylacidiphilum fumarolicum]CCG92469.1 hypothetical protein MFUM_700018 [Methylacidiphilum fumariolicum SolV]
MNDNVAKKDKLLLINDVESVLNTISIESRSLLLEKYIDPRIKKDERKAQFSTAINIKNPNITKYRLQSIWNSLYSKLKDASLLFAQLQSRMMVNMAGGVLENAGLCLDRFGIPYIPGSAAKGCARRMAIEKLLEASEHEKIQLLSQIALVFGWSELDWKNENNSDFYYGCSNTPPLVDDVVDQAAGLVLEAMSIPTKTDDKLRNQLIKTVPNYAGTIRFLPAYPIPENFYPTEEKKLVGNELELDVITCHHQKYYSHETGWEDAWDKEDPIPVFFPAVSPYLIFCFCIHPSTRRANGKVKDFALEWLKNGLESFGIGAKTAAGYGWFKDCTNKVEEKLEKIRKEEEIRQKEQEEKRKKEEEEERRKIEKEKKQQKFEEATKGMSPEEKEAFKLHSEKNDQQFKDKLINDFLKSDANQQLVFYLCIKKHKPGVWEEINKAAQQSPKKEVRKKWANISQKLKEIAKNRKERLP